MTKKEIKKYLSKKVQVSFNSGTLTGVLEAKDLKNNEYSFKEEASGIDFTINSNDILAIIQDAPVLEANPIPHWLKEAFKEVILKLEELNAEYLTKSSFIVAPEIEKEIKELCEQAGAEDLIFYSDDTKLYYILFDHKVRAMNSFRIR